MIQNTQLWRDRACAGKIATKTHAWRIRESGKGWGTPGQRAYNLLDVEDGCLYDGSGDTVRVDVGGRATVLEVAEALCGNVTRDADGSTTVGNTGAELGDACGFVLASKAELVVLTVDSDVLLVAAAKLLDGLLDDLKATLLAHRLGRVVGVAASTVPVTLERLGVEGNLDLPQLGHTDEEVACHPEVVAHLDTLARADLELPLRRHDLGVDTGDVDASVKAGAVVRLDQVTGNDLAGTYVGRTTG